VSAENPTPEEFARHIAESVAALVMLKDQVCGMYAVLDKKSTGQSDHVQALMEAERQIQQLLGQFPRDPLTLEGIRRASDRIEQAAVAIPVSVTASLQERGEAMAKAFTQQIDPEVKRIQLAAHQALQVANDYVRHRNQTLSETVWVAFGVTIVVASMLVAAALWWWIPARADVEAQKAELQRMTDNIKELKERGGLAQIVQCETHLCVRTDESVKAPKVNGAQKAETYRVVKGY